MDLMAPSSSSKAPCNSNSCKSVGILKCEICSQKFCHKHVKEYRDLLSHQLDEIVLEHDTLQRIIAEQKNKMNRHPNFISKELHDIAGQLQKARVDDDFVETDLRKWTDMLQGLRENVTNISSSTTNSRDPK
ncbi:unnamed protein product [Rotaria socialis]|uniref:B box-type domain-containing protein n=1 Tax=Rotaria socialis TaxID=392032 RepID=A0A820Y7E9_9BILA|nr:unnamed protein product [Rotaria socialis]